MLSTLFGDPRDWPDQDLVGLSKEFDVHLAVEGYASGVFPMPVNRWRMGWWSPVERGIIPLDGLRVTRSMRQSARRYTTTIDAAFDEVLARCADKRREGAWIDRRISKAYSQLHRAGIGHSVETWDADGTLVGGLYGVHIAGLFAGEAMFHDPEQGRDASKVALMRLIVDLRALGIKLLDVQWLTPHLESLGAVEISRTEYLRRLSLALEEPMRDWKPEILDGATLLERLGKDS